MEIAFTRTRLGGEHSVMAGQDDIRRSWKIAIPQCKAVPHSVEEAAHGPLRLRVPVVDAAHVPRTFFWCQSVCHQLEEPRIMKRGQLKRGYRFRGDFSGTLLIRNAGTGKWELTVSLICRQKGL